jgi:DNA-binding transcriptional regulator YiaG
MHFWKAGGFFVSALQARTTITKTLGIITTRNNNTQQQQTLSINVPHGRKNQRANESLLPRPHHNTLTTMMLPQQHRSDASKECQMQLAIQAIKQDATLSQRRAAAVYRVSQATLSKRRAGQPSRADSLANSRNLDNNEEQVIVEHILELVARGFPPRLTAMADMADSLRAERNLGHVGVN